MRGNAACSSSSAVHGPDSLLSVAVQAAAQRMRPPVCEQVSRGALSPVRPVTAGPVSVWLFAQGGQVRHDDGARWSGDSAGSHGRRDAALAVSALSSAVLDAQELRPPPLRDSLLSVLEGCQRRQREAHLPSAMRQEVELWESPASLLGDVSQGQVCPVFTGALDLLLSASWLCFHVSWLRSGLFRRLGVPLWQDASARSHQVRAEDAEVSGELCRRSPALRPPRLCASRLPSPERGLSSLRGADRCGVRLRVRGASPRALPPQQCCELWARV
jgi:hypothetical protein